MRQNLKWLQTLFLSGMALGVEKFAELAQGEHDPVKLSVAGGAVAFTTAAHYLVHRAGEQYEEAHRVQVAERNHLVRRGMLSALRRALAEMSQDSYTASGPLQQRLFSEWERSLALAENSEDMERLFPAEVFAEAYWNASNPYFPDQREGAEALAALLREWLLTNLSLATAWDEKQALAFAGKLLPRFQNRFADDLVQEGGVLYQAFLVKGINQLRAIVSGVAERQCRNHEDVMRALNEILARLASGPFEASAPHVSTVPEFAPEKPERFFGREKDVENIKVSLGVTDGHPKTLTVIRGWPGVGKSTLAAHLFHDVSIRKAFPDGLPLWASLGEKPDLFSQLDNWARHLGVDDLRRSGRVKDASNRLRGELLRQKLRLLLLIDDVWDVDDAKTLMVGEQHCVTLITTRLPRVADALVSRRDIAEQRKDIVVLNGLADAPALQLLEEFAPTVVEDHRAECLTLVQELQGLPLALRVAGQMLDRHFNRWSTVAELLEELRSGALLLSESAPSDLIDLNKRAPTVLALLKKSTDLLDRGTQERFARLGIVEEKPATFDIGYLCSQWETNNPKPTVDTLIDCGLLETVGNQRFMMHSLLVALAKWMLDQSAE
jgi:hypothetical protein